MHHVVPAAARPRWFARGLLALLLAVPATRSFAATAMPDAVKQRLQVTRGTVQALHFAGPRAAVPIELDGRRLTLVLEPASFRSAGFRVLVQAADGSLREAPAPAPATVRGRIAELPGSTVGGTLRNGALRAALAVDGRLFYVQPLDAAGGTSDPALHAVYESSDAVTGGGETCAANEPPVLVTPQRGLGSTSVTALRRAQLAIDADYEYFQKNGSNVDSTVRDIENVIAAVDVVYERDCQLTHQLGTVIVRSTAADPYAGTSADSLLIQLRDHWNAAQTGITRDVVHLMTGRDIDGGTIGIAYIGVICSRTRGYGLSQSRFSTNLSRRCALTAHELGHNWNATHCDAVTPCKIMCSSINGCSGIGLPNFEPQGVTAIQAFAASRTCLDSPTAAVGDPLADAGLRFAVQPTPFTKQTGLRFYLEQGGPVELDVYDVAGQHVAHVADGEQSPGWHTFTWQGMDDAGRALRGGVFYARLRIAGGASVQKLVMLK